MIGKKNLHGTPVSEGASWS